jgi:hypothetical protein
MARGSAGATLVVMTDDLDHGHRATSRLYRQRQLAARPVSCPSRQEFFDQRSASRSLVRPGTFAFSACTVS